MLTRNLFKLSWSRDGERLIPRAVRARARTSERADEAARALSPASGLITNGRNVQFSVKFIQVPHSYHYYYL